MFSFFKTPQKEGRALLPGNNQRPADIFIPRWAGDRDAALDVTVTHPLQDATRVAAEPGYALTFLPRPVPPCPADFHPFPTPTCPAPRILNFAPHIPTGQTISLEFFGFFFIHY